MANTPIRLPGVAGTRHIQNGSPSPRVLPQVLQVNSLIQTQKSAELAAALLSVYLERADELPVRATPRTP